MTLLAGGLMVGPRTVVSKARALWRELSSDDVGDFAAGLSYRFFLALFPFFIFLTAVGGVVARIAGIENPSERVLDELGGALPEDARSVIDGQLRSVLGEEQPGLLSVGLLGTIWAASGGVGALMKAMNRMYDVQETRPFWRRTLLALGLTAVGGLFFVGAFILAVAGRAIASAVVDAAGLGDPARAAITVAGYVFALALLMVAMAFLYWAAPNAKLPFKWLTPGAILFAVVWLLATLGFGFYVSNFGSYNATYGALGGVVILLVWFYLTAYILLAGAEVNAMVAQQTEPEEAEVPEADPGRWEPAVEQSARPDAAARTVQAGQRQPQTSGVPSPGAGREEQRSGPRTPAAAAQANGHGALMGLTGALVAGIALWRAVGARR